MEARAIQYSVRQSARKMRLVIDQIRGRVVPEAYAILKFSKKLAARQIHKVLKSAVANAEQLAQRTNEALDVDRLRVKYAVVNEGQTLKRFTPASMGRGTPIMKRTSHVEIRVAPDAQRVAKTSAPAAAKAEGKTRARAATPKKPAAKAASAKKSERKKTTRRGSK
jgi:large subunit ribosomal protein L22